jgi:hypothetical protein
MSRTLEIFAQYGDPESTGAVRPLQQLLNRVLEECLTGKYFHSIEKLSIFLRVSGSIWKFEPEGPDRLRYRKRDKEITIDLVIPENRWRGVGSAEMQAYVADQVKRCFGFLLARARKEKGLIDEDALASDLQRAMNEFENAQP